MTTTILRSLRVTADMDSGPYARGAKQVTAADQAMIAAKQALATAWAAGDAAQQKAEKAVERLSRKWVEGYKQAEVFEKTVRQIGHAVDRGMGLDRASVMVTNLSTSLGRMANSQDLARQGFVALVPVIDQVNAAIRQNIAAQDAAAKAAAEASAMSNVLVEMQRRELMAAQAADQHAIAVAGLTAKYSPATAAMQNYHKSLQDIERASKLIKISEDERAAATMRAQTAYHASTQGMGGLAIAPQAVVGQQLSGRSASASAAAMQDAWRETERMAQATKLLRLEIEPLAMAQARLDDEMAEYKSLQQAGFINEQQLALAQNAALSRFSRTEQILQQTGAHMRLNRHEMANLSYQFNDIAVMLASGQSPFMLMMQQGMQIGQIIGPAGLQGGLKALGAGIVAFVTNPVNLAVVAFAGLASGAGYLISMMKSGLPTLEDNLKRMSELSRDLADSLGSAGTNIDKMASASSRVVEFKARINVEETIATLQKRLREEIQSAGNGIGALNPQELALMPPGMMEESGFKELLPLMRQILDMKDPSIRVITGLQEELVRLANAFPESKKAAAELLMALDPLAEGVRRVEARITSLDEAMQKFKRSAAVTGPLLEAIKGVRPELRSPRELLDENYNKAANAAVSMGQLQQLTEAYQKSLEYLNAETRKSADLHQIELDAIDAKSPKQLAEIAALRAKTNAINTAVGATQADIEAMRAYEIAFRNATKAIEEQAKARLDAANESISSLLLEIDLVGKSSSEVALLRDNWRLEMEMRREAAKNGVEIDKNRLEYLKAINAEAARLNQILSVAKFGEELATEARLRDMAPGEADIFKRLKAAGIDEGTEAWKRYAEQLREVNREQKSFGYGLKQGFNELVDHVNDFAASGKDIFDNFFGGLEEQWVNFAKTGKFSFKDLINTIIGDISRLAYRMTMSGIMGLLGFGSTSQSGGGTSFGGVFRTLLGNVLGGGGKTSAPSTSGGGAGVMGWLGSLFGGGSSGSAAPSQGGFTAPSVSGGLGLLGALPGPLGWLGAIGGALGSIYTGRTPTVASAAPVPVPAGTTGGGFSSSSSYFGSTFFDLLPKNPFSGFSFSMPTFGDKDKGGGFGGILSSIVSPIMSLFGGGKSKVPGRTAGGIGAGLSSPLVPANASVAGLYGSGPLLNMIGRYEGTDRGRGYNETLDYGRWTGGDVNLTSMTLDQVYQLGLNMRTPENRALYGNGQGSSALGRYQITGRTMRNLQKQMGLKGDELFDPAMQDRMAMMLAQGRGANLAGLRSEWVGLNKAPDKDLLAAYRQQMQGFSGDAFKGALDPNMQAQWQERMKQAQQALAQNAGELAATAHRFSNDLSSSLNSITSGAQSAGSGFGSALGGVLQSILGSVGGTGGGMIGSVLSSFLSIFAKGGAFGGATAFASGSAFANTVYSKPTMFRYGSGQLGVMGEAGPEAVMPLMYSKNGLGVRAMIAGREISLPLARSKSGHLGVGLHGGGGGDKLWWQVLEKALEKTGVAPGSFASTNTPNSPFSASENKDKSPAANDWGASMSHPLGDNGGGRLGSASRYALGNVFGASRDYTRRMMAMTEYNPSRGGSAMVQPGSAANRNIRRTSQYSQGDGKVVNVMQVNNFTAPRMNEARSSQNQMAAKANASLSRRLGRTS